MNFKPILFSTEMVRAILDGRKTQTRRTKGLEEYSDTSDDFYWILEDVTNDPNLIIGSYANGDDRIRKAVGCYAHFRWSGTGDIWKAPRCPYGQIGDVLWVRETFKPAVFAGTPIDGFDYKLDHVIWLEKNGQPWRPKSGCEEGEKWRPGIHMPKAACRIFLEITDIRVERLADISEEDAKAEGVESWIEERMRARPTHFKLYWREPGDDSLYSSSAKDSFESLWKMINGQESWEDNPFVWAITFRRIDKPENFAV